MARLGEARRKTLEKVVNGMAFANTYATVVTSTAARKLMEEEKAKEEKLRRGWED